MEKSAKAFTGNPFDDNYQAAARANEIVYGVKPDFSRSIRMTEEKFRTCWALVFDKI